MYRAYDPERDVKHAITIWEEIAWIENDAQKPAVETFLKSVSTSVAVLDDRAEAFAASTIGDIDYMGARLPFSAVLTVGTSTVARNKGFALNLTARRIAEDAERGALVAGLGIFDQGFYDRVGFGTGAYEHHVSFDPATLTITTPYRTPSRLDLKKDASALFKGLCARKRDHGSVALTEEHVRAFIGMFAANCVAYGYYDDEGLLTHHILVRKHSGENGPYEVEWMSFQTHEQFLELMALLKSFAAQVFLVKMREPRGIQMQDLVSRPFRGSTITKGNRYETKVSASAYWQVRILSIEGVLAKTTLPTRDTFRVNLHIDDPVTAYLPEDAAWKGCAGDYVVTLGETCSAERGHDAALPTLSASVGAFSRMWLGAAPASGLAVTDDLRADRETLARLDALFRLPSPSYDWNF